MVTSKSFKTHICRPKLQSFIISIKILKSSTHISSPYNKTMSTVLNCTHLTSSTSPTKPGLIGGNAPKVTLINISTNQKSKFERFQALEVKASSDGAKTSTTSKSLVCESCEGNGKILCTQCNGAGVNTEDHFNGRFKAGGLCWLCRGKREILCGGCNGAGYAGGFMSTADE